MLREVKPAMQSGHERDRLAGKQRKRIIVQMEMKEIEFVRSPPHPLQHQHMQCVGISHRSVQAQRPRPRRLKPCRGARVRAGVQCDIMSEGNEFLGQPINDPLSSAIQLRRDGFGQRRNLSDLHLTQAPYFAAPRACRLPSRIKSLRKMQIAQIAPLTEAIPPKLYGGTERVVYWLTEELVALGHDVTLYASADSRTSARLEAPWPRALRLDGSVRDPNALHMLMLERVRRRADEFDFLHFHLDYYPFSLFSRQAIPFVTTLHGRLDLPEHQPVFTTFSSVPVVSISDAQRRPLPQAGWVQTIYHGLPEQLLSPLPVKPQYFAFLGRIAPEKGVDRAI